MGFFSWLGFGKPRDAPGGAKTERPGLPEITDNVRDSPATVWASRQAFWMTPAPRWA